MKTINMHQAKALIDQHNIDSLVYVDKINSGGNHIYVIFKKKHSDQLYQFYYYTVDGYPDILVDTIQQFYNFLDESNHKLGVRVIPVKKVTVTKYVRDDSNDWYY